MVVRTLVAVVGTFQVDLVGTFRVVLVGTFVIGGIARTFVVAPDRTLVVVQPSCIEAELVVEGKELDCHDVQQPLQLRRLPHGSSLSDGHCLLPHICLCASSKRQCNRCSRKLQAQSLLNLRRRLFIKGEQSTGNSCLNRSRNCIHSHRNKFACKWKNSTLRPYSSWLASSKRKVHGMSCH